MNEIKKGEVVYLNSDLKKENPLTVKEIPYSEFTNKNAICLKVLEDGSIQEIKLPLETIRKVESESEETQEKVTSKPKSKGDITVIYA